MTGVTEITGQSSSWLAELYHSDIFICRDKERGKLDQAATRRMVTSGLWEPGKAKIRVEEEGEQGYQFPGLVCNKCGVICWAGLAAFKAHLEACGQPPAPVNSPSVVSSPAAPTPAGPSPLQYYGPTPSAVYSPGTGNYQSAPVLQPPVITKSPVPAQVGAPTFQLSQPRLDVSALGVLSQEIGKFSIWRQ